jgi:hypothetical protein
MRIGRVMHDQARGGHRPYEMMELTFDSLDVRVNVRMVKLEIIEDDGPRAVVNELRTLIKESRVVLVRLDDEERALAKTRTDTEIVRNAANQKPG